MKGSPVHCIHHTQNSAHDEGAWARLQCATAGHAMRQGVTLQIYRSLAILALAAAPASSHTCL